MTDTPVPSANLLREALAAGKVDETPAETPPVDHADETPTETPEEAPATTEDEFTDEERAAMAQGWDPYFDGPNKRSAREFLDRGELLAKIKGQSHTISELNKKVDFLLKREAEVKKATLESALATLKQQKKDAIQDRDADVLLEIDDKIAAVAHEITKLGEVPPADDAQPEVEIPEPLQAWVNSNKWYTEDEEMRAVADSIGSAHLAKLQGDKAAGRIRAIDPMKVMAHVEQRIRALYPKSQYFERSGGKVESGNQGRRSRAGKGGKHTASDLSAEELQVMNNMLRVGKVKSADEYISNLEKVGYFKDR